jgi:hypothetical protein
VASYFMGNKHYPVNYDLKRILGYLGLSVTLYALSTFIQTGFSFMDLIIDNLLLLGFIIIIWMLEKNNFKSII